MSRYYILDDNHRPVPVPEMQQWARWFETADRHVAEDETTFFLVSTVFLGLDHSWGKGPPILFETMVFEREHDGDVLDWGGTEQRRYASWDDAESGHRATVKRLLKQEAEAETVR